MTWLLVALGAAVGASTRFLVGRWLDRSWPFGTLLVNVVGSALLGVFSALAVTSTLGTAGLALLGTGFCGGLTTFSSFVVGLVAQHEKGHVRSSTYLVATVVASLVACWLGFALTA